MGILVFPGVKLPGCEDDHLPPSGADVKNEWSFTSAPPICLHGVDRDFTFRVFLFFFSQPIQESARIETQLRPVAVSLQPTHTIKLMK